MGDVGLMCYGEMGKCNEVNMFGMDLCILNRRSSRFRSLRQRRLRLRRGVLVFPIPSLRWVIVCFLLLYLKVYIHYYTIS